MDKSKSTASSSKESESNENIKKKSKFVFKSKSTTTNTFIPPCTTVKADINKLSTTVYSVSKSPSMVNSQDIDSDKNHMEVDETNYNLATKDNKSIDKKNSPSTSKPIVRTASRTHNTLKMNGLLKQQQKVTQHNDISINKVNNNTDNTLSEFILKLNENKALKLCDKDKSSITVKDIEVCKELYIELLEKISEEYQRLSNIAKRFIPGYDESICLNTNILREKLKSIIQTQTINGSESRDSNINDIIQKTQDSLNTNDNSPESSEQIFKQKESKSTFEIFNKINKNTSDSVLKKTSNKITLTDKSKSIDCVTHSESELNRKGKFVFKRPSCTTEDFKDTSEAVKNVTSNTFERIKNVSERLQPLQTGDSPKLSPLPASSVPFQPPPLSKTLNSPVVETPSPNNITCEESDTDIDVPVDWDDDTDVSFVNDSIAASCDVEPDSSRYISVDDEGWQVYRPEDFEEDNTPSEIVNEADTVYESMGDFEPGTKNDGATGEFDGTNYPHSEEMMKVLKEKFGLRSFRPNQLQVINATMLGHDCFVLMPTGGGKSLCYQLTAVLTPGITIVISPLRSLILDQTSKLNSLDIPAAYFSGEMSESEANNVYYQLSMAEPTIKLLYVTPEKLTSSEKFKSTLDMLYSRNMIARFVVDEAHCVSAWGHDFRPDYKRLGVLRRSYPRARLMALTATATPRVRTDILHQLGVKNCKWFLCSFNRPNLSYEVLEKKGKNINQDIIKVIQQRFSRQSGIVYCLSRKDCDAMALDLKKAGMQAASYHAGLAPRTREDVQMGWLADRYRVICATIAFGMGVDKADVRFVIHHSLPKSVEGYYQEAGRAGRDGAPAACLLYYSYTDVARIRSMIQKEKNTTAAARQVHEDNLMRMAEMCENVSECRRVHVLAYLGERYERARCRAGAAPCDVCRAGEALRRVDVTDTCRTIARAVRDLRGSYTLLQLADVLRGSLQQRVVALRASPLHSLCKTWARGDPSKLLRQLLFAGVLGERLVVHNDIPTAYIKAGPKIDELLSGELRIEFPKQTSLGRAAAPSPARVSLPAGAGLDARLKALEDRCYTALVEACSEMAAARGASVAALFPQAALRAMARRLPEDAAGMLALPHVTRANYEKYGQRLLSVTAEYALVKLGILMEYQDELERRAVGAEWRAAAQSSAAPRRARKTQPYITD